MRSRPSPKPTPPLLRGLPLVGSLPAFWKDPVAVCRRGYETLGPVFTVDLGIQKAAVLIGPEHQGFFFQQTDRCLSMREAYRFVGPLFQEDIMFLADEKEHQEQRAIFFPAFQGKRLHGYVRAMVREVEAWADTLGDEGELEVVEAFRELTMYVAARALLGDGFRERLGPRFGVLFKDLIAGVEYVLPPNLPLPRFRRRDRAKAGLHELMRGILAERRAHPERYDDFCQTLVEARYSDGRPLADKLISNLILGLTWSGYETTSGSMGWVLVLLLQHPEILARVRAEQEAVLGEGGGLSLESLGRMRCLESVLRESERLRPVVSVLIRNVTEETEIAGYRIPKGWRLLVCPSVAHRLPEVFRDPERFDPDRFAPERAEKLPPFSLIGFGGAHHRCVGINFASAEMSVIALTLLRRYDLELLTPAPETQTEPGTLRGPKPPCVVRYRRRTEERSRSERPAVAVPGSAEDEPAGGGRCPFH